MLSDLGRIAGGNLSQRDLVLDPWLWEHCRQDLGKTLTLMWGGFRNEGYLLRVLFLRESLLFGGLQKGYLANIWSQFVGLPYLIVTPARHVQDCFEKFGCLIGKP